MVINKMNEEECCTILRRSLVGRLGCSRENQPYIMPIHLAYEAGYIYVFSTFGQKIQWMRANPKVCLEVDEIVSDREWVTVIVIGRYEELAEPQYTDERDHARKLLEKRNLWWLNAAAERRLQSSDELIEPLFFRVKLDSVTGLRAVAERTASAAL